MTVKELIQQLQQHDPNKLVLVQAYEEGFNELHAVEQVKTFHKSSDKHWVGEYRDYPLDECLVSAILLPRK
jgi:hypothetical protein